MRICESFRWKLLYQSSVVGVSPYRVQVNGSMCNEGVYLFQSKETPLHMAAKVKGGEKVVDVLIKSGADPDTAKEVFNFFTVTPNR